MSIRKNRYDLSYTPESENEEKSDCRTELRSSIHSVPFISGVGVIIYLALLFLCVYLIDNKLPKDLRISDEIQNPDRFIAERAIDDLKKLTNLGPRIVGSYENEYLAVDFLTREINSIIYRSNSNQKIELDIQITSGAFYLNLLSVDEINTYSHVKNVVVKIHGRSNSSTSILVNSHYDSVPTSPGGSDDGINVVTMLEILRKLSKSPERPYHNIILLFNGAEETVLQASHGFITQHKWSSECKIVINLEAAGHGGKIILFQTGPKAPWLMKYYTSVPYPYGQAAGEEIFQSGMVPSDTDFRIFRDFGGLVGYDMAFCKSGYRYHTKFDDFQNIPNGSYQNVGDNTLHLLKGLANDPNLLNSTETSGNIVYYDILGLFMVVYTTLIAAILNYSTVIVSIVIFVISMRQFQLGYSKTSVKYIFLTAGIIVSGWLLAFVGVFVIALILDLLNRTMSWYGSPWLLGGLYVLPTIILSGCLYPFINNESLSLNIRCQIQGHIVRLLWTLILLIGTILNIRAMYALVIPILFNSLAFIIIHSSGLQHSRRYWLFVYFGLLIIPTLITMYELLMCFILFVPLTGRIGSNKNPDLIIGLMTSISTVIVISPYVALTSLMSKLKYYYICLGAIFVIFFIIVFTPLGFPYNGDVKNPTPQRYWITHSKRVFYNESGLIEKTDSGVYFLNMDRNSPKKVESYVTDISKAKSLKEDCDKYVLCGLPLAHVKMIQIMEYGTWIPANQPILPKQLQFIVNSKRNMNSTLIRYNVTVSGSDRINVYILPKLNMTLVNISLIANVPQPDYLYKNRKLFFVHFASGQDHSNLTFTFDIKAPANYNGLTTDIAANTIFLHDKKNNKTPYFLKMIQQFPSWADVTAYLAHYSSHVI